MGESVRVRCPECLRTQSYAVPVFPCACGTPVVPPVVPGATGEPITHRNWTDEWVTVRCVACGREDEWPHPELGCTCGTVLRVPVLPPGPADGAAGTAPEGGEWRGGTPSVPGQGGRRPAPEPARTGGPDGTRTGTRAGAQDGGRGLPRGGPRTGGEGDAARPEHRDGAGAWTEDVARVGDRDREYGRLPGGRGGPEGDGRDATARPDGTARPGLPAAEPGSLPDAADTGLGKAPDDGDRGQGAARRHGDVGGPSVPAVAAPRAAFRPVVIRTARDAVAASAGYLRWLGYRDVVQPEERSASGADLRAPGLVAQVDPSTRPSTLRAVECLWLNGLSSSAASVFFSLAGYTPDARSRADDLGIPLFVLDLTGTPQPVNSHAEKLISTTGR